MTDHPASTSGNSPGTLARAFLLITRGANTGHALALDRSAVVIGRAEDVDLQVPDRAVSTVHAIVRIDPDGAASIQDLRSTNGTRVNGRKITTEHPLKEGDEITIGAATSLKFTRDADLVERYRQARSAE